MAMNHMWLWQKDISRHFQFCPFNFRPAMWDSNLVWTYFLTFSFYTSQRFLHICSFQSNSQTFLPQLIFFPSLAFYFNHNLTVACIKKKIVASNCRISQFPNNVLLPWNQGGLIVSELTDSSGKVRSD